MPGLIAFSRGGSLLAFGGHRGSKDLELDVLVEAILAVIFTNCNSMTMSCLAMAVMAVRVYFKLKPVSHCVPSRMKMAG